MWWNGSSWLLIVALKFHHLTKPCLRTSQSNVKKRCIVTRLKISFRHRRHVIETCKIWLIDWADSSKIRSSSSGGNISLIHWDIFRISTTGYRSVWEENVPFLDTHRCCSLQKRTSLIVSGPPGFPTHWGVISYRNWKMSNTVSIHQRGSDWSNYFKWKESNCLMDRGRRVKAFRWERILAEEISVFEHITNSKDPMVDSSQINPRTSQRWSIPSFLSWYELLIKGYWVSWSVLHLWLEARHMLSRRLIDSLSFVCRWWISYGSIQFRSFNMK